MLTYCSHCVEKHLAQKSEILPSILFEYISLLYFNGSTLELSTNEDDVRIVHGEGVHEAFQWLEQNGFIVTCDSGLELVKVKPLGFRISFEPYYGELKPTYHFCKCQGLHAN